MGKRSRVRVGDNNYTAQFWEYDSRVGRRWNRDPKPNLSISDYAVLGGNPILFSDVLGDTLDIGKDDYSKADIFRMVSDENRKYVDFENNRVKLMPGMSLESDEGAKLLTDLVTSDKKFLYEASDVMLIRNEAGEKTSGMTYTMEHNIINASEYGKDSDGGHYYRPKEGYDGQVIIHPGVILVEYESRDIRIDKSRASLVFHELAENYNRTHNNIDYAGVNGAHNLAISREKKWTAGWSISPGEGVRIIKGERPSADRIKEIVEIINKYTFGK